MDGKIVLVTGASGLLGRRLGDKLLFLGVKELRLFDVRNPKAKNPDRRATYIEGTLHDIQRFLSR